MKIDYDRKLVFLQNTKVASTSLDTAMRKSPYNFGAVEGVPFLKHMNYTQFLKIAGVFRAEGFTTVCVIRHPVDKAVSWYRYRSRPKLKGRPNYTGNMTLSQFAASVSDRSIDPRNFIFDPTSGTSVDMVFRYTDMDRYSEWLQSIYGPEFALPQRNVSPSRGLGDTSALEERFADAIAWYEALEIDPATGAVLVPAPTKQS